MKSFKRIWMTLIIMMLSIAMVIGTMSFTAFALTVGNSQTFADKINIVSKVVYGGTFNVPNGTSGTTVKVTAPNGSVIAPNGGKITANQVGTYTISYSTTVGEKTYDYDFDVYSYVEEDYTVKVALGGAEIPTYIKTNTEFTLPAANLVYYDEDGKEVKSDVPVKIKTTLNTDVYNADGNQKITPAASGNLYITYYAQLGDNGGKYYSKDFMVKVQDTFVDTVAPTLNVVNVPKNANINKKVTLPVATATDSLDENIAIKVNVTFGNEPVAEVDVDEDGFAVVKENAPAIEFDNDKVMSFYPTKEGQYTVTYQAFDDAGNQSGLHTYTIDSSDKSAAVFKSIDDYKIPANWGLTVTNNNTTVDSKISFPVPTMIDNAGTDGLTVSFKITEAESNTTIISFNNILAASDSDDFKYVSKDNTYGDTDGVYLFSDPFDFGLIKTDNQTGDFNVEYRAKDKIGNVSTKTYKITVTNEYDDSEKASETSIVDAPAYIVIAPDFDTFEVPAIEVSDKGDSRPHIVYELKSAADTENTLTLKGGETLEIETIEGSSYLKLSDTERVKIAGGQDVTLSLTVTDNVGNVTSDSKTLKVFSSGSQNSNLALDVTNLKYANNAGAFKTGEIANLGSFEINVGDAAFRSFTGYELSIKNPVDGNYITDVASEYYYNTETNKIVVRNIQFTPLNVGVYQISVKAFDLSGNNIVSVGLIDVQKGEDDGTTTTAAPVPSKGNVNVNYSFRNTSIKVPGSGTYFAVYKIRGSKHAVMGTELTAKTANSYFITDGYAKYESNNLAEMIAYDPYQINVSDNESPVIEVQGVMPTYSAKSVKDTPVTVTLPSIVAFNANGNGEVEVKVQLSKGGSIDTKYDADTNTYSFVPDKDGEYKIIVTGTVNNKTTSAEYKLNVGDVTGPKFTVNNPFSERVTVGKEFVFSSVTATADSHETVEEFTYTKTLIDPSKEVVSEATISGKGTDFANKTVKDSNTKITLSKSGTYEVKYEVTDKVGNTTTYTQSIVVTSKTGKSSVSIAAISTVLIVVGVVLIAAVILYFVLFRKRKEKNN